MEVQDEIMEVQEEFVCRKML